MILVVAAVGVLMAVIIHKKRERERGGVVIEETVPNQPPNIEVAAASPNSNPRNGASLLARARVLNLLRGRKKRIIEGEVVYLEQFKSLYLSN